MNTNKTNPIELKLAHRKVAGIICRLVLFGLLAMAFLHCQALAKNEFAKVSFYGGGTQETEIRFDEPIVSKTTVENARDNSLPAADRGLDLFSIAGDAKHAPKCQWVDQDRLRISYVPGTSCKTQYTLTFKPGTTLLSGKQIPQRQVSFHCPADDLAWKTFHDDKGVAALLTPCNNLTLESRTFSANSPLRYAFFKVKHSFWSGDRYLAGRVEAVAEPAQLRHGVMRETLERLSEKGEGYWKKLRPDSALPGHIIVRPVKPLDPDEEWALVCHAEKGSGFYGKEVIYSLNPIPELLTEVDYRCGDVGKGQLQLVLKFSEPMDAAAMPGIFQRLAIMAGKDQAVNSPDGKTKTLATNGQKIVFSYGRTIGPETVRTLYQKECLGYKAPGQAHGMTVNVSAPAPVLLDVVVPEGVRGSLGQATACDHRHRIALNPAWPKLDASGNALVLPLKGDHKLKFPATNLQAINATLRKLPPDLAERAYFNGEWDNKDAREACFIFNINCLRRREGLAKPDLPYLKRIWKRANEDLMEQTKARQEFLAQAPPCATRRIPVPCNGMLASAEAVIDLDAVAGERLAPGMYLLTLHAEANGQVQQTAAMQKQKSYALNREFDILVQITDLNALPSQNGILVTRISNGEAITSGSLEFQNQQGVREHHNIRNGVAMADLATSRDKQCGVVACGGDRVIFSLPNKEESDEDDKKDTRTLLIQDRPMYRPGDTVHLRGILRICEPGGTCRLPKLARADLTVCRPNGEELLSQQINLGDYGAFAEDFSLPTGEEDVAGNYEVSVESGDFSATADIKCQVFRRNAFEAELQAVVAPVAPKEAALRISARDYNGMPLSGGKVQLKIVSPQANGDLGSGESEKKQETHNLTLDAGGQAELTLPLSPAQVEAGSLSVSGSVANDREEYVTLPEQTLKFSPADFRISFYDGRVYLTDSATGQKFGRSQDLHVEIQKEERILPKSASGFARYETETRTLWAGPMHVPANAAQGEPLPLPALAAQQSEGPAAIKISGQDAEGRRTTLLRRDVEPFSSRPGEPGLEISAQAKERQVELKILAPHAGVAHAFISRSGGIRHVDFKVDAGENARSVELDKGEEGELGISLVLPHCGTAEAPSFAQASASCFVPSASGHLEVAVEVPAVCRPGGTATISGKVSGQKGKAEVTLYAVDAGMLSILPYAAPQPEKFFAPGHMPLFIPQTSHIFRNNWHGARNFKLIDAIWRGELVGRGFRLPIEDESRGSGYGPSWGIAPAPIALPSMAFDSAKEEAEEGELLPPWIVESDGLRSGGVQIGSADLAAKGKEALPRLRTNFEPVAVWKGATLTDADGNFEVSAALPDTLTTYRVFAVALDRSGGKFGSAEGEMTVSQPLMLTPGTPLFMSTGDTLSLPVTISNNTRQAGVWTVQMEEDAASRTIELAAQESGVLYFEVKATSEGVRRLRWIAQGETGQDAVEGSFPVRFPAPLLKEIHRFALEPGQKGVELGALFAQEVGTSARSEVEITASANPLLHMAGCADFLLEYPYGCTEQKASALLPWLMYDRLAPFCPKLAKATREQAKEHVQKALAEIWARQCKDGGLGYWCAGEAGSPWASAYAAVVLQTAQKAGYPLPEDKMRALLRFLRKADIKDTFSPLARYAAARALNRRGEMRQALVEPLKWYEDDPESIKREPVRHANLVFLYSLHANPQNRQAAFLEWLRCVGRDYRHGSTWDDGWALLALLTYLDLEPGQKDGQAVLGTGKEAWKLGLGPTAIPVDFQRGKRLDSLTETFSAIQGTAYLSIRAKAQPEQTEFKGVTERGLQVTRLYETKGEDDVWRPAQELHVGDVVRVTLTCAKIADELEYLVLEDYLPSCMEAINPEIASQAAGLEPLSWSEEFDHREYLADRVRGFCSRWGGRNLVNMRYYARVKRAGDSMAPPAQAQLMYEPQTYGLSPNTRVHSAP